MADSVIIIGGIVGGGIMLLCGIGCIVMVICICRYKKQNEQLKEANSSKNSPNNNQQNNNTPKIITTTPTTMNTTTTTQTSSMNNDLTSSSTGTATVTGTVNKNNDFDFLVNPQEQYLSQSQTQTHSSGYNGHIALINMNTVTISNSNHQYQQSSPQYIYQQQQQISPNINININNNQQINQLKQLQKYHQQQAQLNEVIKGAKNKLQLINSQHISFEYEVGRGKFGKVFRAQWTDSNRQQKTVAVKWFKQDEVDQEVFNDFLKEISVAAQLPPHENVLRIYGYCMSPYALVTEYVNGGSVEMSVSSKHKKSIRSSLNLLDIVQIFIDTAKGISHLHTVNIIHRDVAARNLLIEDLSLEQTDYNKNKKNKKNKKKPNINKKNLNVSIEFDLNSDNNNNNKINNKKKKKKHALRRVVVCDFGLSRITQNPDQDNVTNSHIGPLKWMSPESIKQQIYNSKTDVYSFGVVMWEILCGMPPYPNTKVLSLAVEVISKSIRPYILSWFPRPLSILMQRCWQEIPEYRPSFDEIKNELQLFKKELLQKSISSNNSNNLITILPNDLPKTKEKLRNLNDLVNNYLNEDKYHWDAIIKPKLIKLINKYNNNNNINILKSMNVFTKRLNHSIVTFSDQQTTNPDKPNMQNVGSIPINNNQSVLGLIDSDSLPINLTNAHHADLSLSVNSDNTIAIHNNGMINNSVQIDYTPPPPTTTTNNNNNTKSLTLQVQDSGQ